MPEYTQQQFNALAHVYESLDATAVFKQQPEDFVVVEQLPFELSGEGEHAWLQIRKRCANTDWVAGMLAGFADVKKQAVGYAGLKDRNAVTTHWFSVHLPGNDSIDWNDMSIEGVELLQSVRHQRKLQRGALKQNHFTIRLRTVQGDVQKLLERCELIRQQGVPNYFGEQRFGRDFTNLPNAERMFTQPKKRLPRHKRSLYLSAARSWLFNNILSERVTAGAWNRRVDGDVFMLDGRSACFTDDGSQELDQRLEQGEIHPTAVLWGDGESMARQDCLELELSVVERYPVFKQGLIDARVDQQRRSMRLMVRDLVCAPEGGDIVLDFGLPAGAYATMVLRELVDYEAS